VIDSFDLGGAQTFLLDLVKNLDAQRFVPEVASMHGHGVFEPAFREAGIKTHSLSPGKMPPFYIPNFIRLMRAGKYDVLHFHLFGANLCAKPLAIAAGHPAIIVHDQCNDASRDRNPLLLAADALANRGADRVIAVSESVRNYLIEREGLSEEKVEMIPNGLDARFFNEATAAQKLEARKKFCIPPESLLIGGVGRLVPQKNFGAFLKVASLVLVSNPDVHFMIAGSGPMEASLRSEAVSLGLAGHIHFLGHVSDRATIYQALDILFMPSDFEGTPMTLLEAMASGLPVVASAVDGIAEVCTDGGDALLVPPRDVGGYADAINRMLADDTLRQEIGARARETVLARYDIRQLAAKIEKIYEEVLTL
jgi:glycosyltransferase involved in cell wall biosynthesis